MTRKPSQKRPSAAAKKSSKKRAAASKQRADAAPSLETALTFAQSPRRAGLPDSASIVGVVGFTPSEGTRPLALASESTESAPAAKYRMILTNEVDAYEKKPKQGEILAEMFTAQATSDSFAGTSRKAAKLSIANAKMETFSDLRDLLASLPSVEVMRKRKPQIKTDATSNRVTEEKRNVRVRAFLYAHSREDDNDFHLIIGRDPEKTPEMYMTMELSGLPPSSSASFSKLKAARNAYKKFFGSALPGAKYVFPDPPVPVLIEGSLFFDQTHAKGSRPGPQSLRNKMPTVWEVHPISKMKLEP